MKLDEIIQEALERRESLKALFNKAVAEGLSDSSARLAAELRLAEKILFAWLQGQGAKPTDAAEATMTELLDGGKPRRSVKRGPRHRQP